MDCGWNICGGSHFVSSRAHFAGSANICLDQRLTFPWWRLYRGQSCVVLLTVQCLGALLCSSIQQKCCVNQMWWIVRRAFWGLETTGRPCWSFLPFFCSFLKDDGKKYSRGIKTCLLRMTEKKDDWVAAHRFQNNVCSLLLTSLILLMELTLSLFVFHVKIISPSPSWAQSRESQQDFKYLTKIENSYNPTTAYSRVRFQL